MDLKTVALASALGLALGCTPSEQSAPAARTTPRPSPADATPSPAPTREDPAVGAEGSPLRPLGARPPTATGEACSDLGEEGWTSEGCIVVEMASGRLAAQWERRNDDSIVGTRRITIWTLTGGTWTARLRADGEPDTWGGLNAREIRIVPGEPHVAVGYRYAGTGDILDYDILDWPRGGAPRVVARRAQLSRGSVRFSEARVVEAAADYPNNEPNCCPPRFAQTVIIYSDGAYRIAETSYIEPNDVPGSDL
jgi:hypothetical protein